MNKTLKEIWMELAAVTDSSEGIRRMRLDPDKYRIYAGWSMPINQPALVIETATASLPSDIELPQSIGFRIAITPLSAGRDGKVRITVESQDKRFSDIFPVLIQDAYEYMIEAENETELIRRTVSRLHHWQVFLKNHKKSRLSESAQIGLWGELWFLKSRLLQYLGMDSAVNSWLGPEGKNQDFEFEGIAVEVKTTSANPHERLYISNVRQLEPAGLDRLYLYHIALAVHHESGMSLPDIIRRLREFIKQSPLSLERFNEKLFKLGYLDSEASWYSRTGYHVLSQNAYLVHEGFPRISLESIPQGVGDVKFSLVLSACSDYKVTPDPFSEEEQ